jgi:hypothetical protein
MVETLIKIKHLWQREDVKKVLSLVLFVLFLLCVMAGEQAFEEFLLKYHTGP